MRLEEIKKGFWGYKKDDVFQYITELEDNLSEKIREKDARAEQADKQAQKRIQTLEDENRALKSELEKLRTQQDQISMAILDARASADAMKEVSRSMEEAARGEVKKTLENELSRIADYKEKVNGLKELIVRTLKEFEEKTEELEKQADEVKNASPEGNLSLFQ